MMLLFDEGDVLHIKIDSLLIQMLNTVNTISSFDAAQPSPLCFYLFPNSPFAVMDTTDKSNV